MAVITNAVKSPLCRWGLFFCLSTLAVVLASAALDVGSADLATERARYELNSRLKARKAIDAALLNRADELLNQALKSNPSNGSAAEIKALVALRRSFLSETPFPDRVAALDDALLLLLKEAGLRPTSGYVYSLIALVKQQRGERDAVLRRALILAVRYGPYEPGVQENVIEVGLRAWNLLSETERDAVRQVIANSLEARPKEAADMFAAKRVLFPPCKELNMRIPKICA